MGFIKNLFGKKKETTTEEEVLPFLKEIKRIDKPMGIAIGDVTYSVTPFTNMVEISINDKLPIGIYKYKFMDLEDILSEAESYYNAGMYEEAQESIEQAITIDNKQPEDKRDWRVYYIAGYICMKRRIFDAAAGLFTTAIEYDCPHKVKVFNSMGACLSILGEKKNAEEAYLLALKCDDSNTETLHNIGGFYWDCNNLTLGADYYIKALENDNEYIPTYEEIGNLLNTMGNEQLGNYFLEIFKIQAIDQDTKTKISEAREFINGLKDD